MRGRKCDPCRGASNRASTKKTVENRNERKLNRQQETASWKAELEDITFTRDKIDFENAVIEAKINHKNQERDSYLEWRRGQTSFEE